MYSPTSVTWPALLIGQVPAYYTLFNGYFFAVIVLAVVFDRALVTGRWQESGFFLVVLTVPTLYYKKLKTCRQNLIKSLDALNSVQWS